MGDVFVHPAKGTAIEGAAHIHLNQDAVMFGGRAELGLIHKGINSASDMTRFSDTIQSPP
jgi:hypothetical protein